MTTTDPVAKAIGLEGYATESNGIGGVLKARVSDFRVDEISTSISLDSRGRFTVARITLTNWETNKFCNNLAKRLGISRNRIFFAGTKDKRAVTQQLFVIDATQHKLAQIEIPDVEIEIIGRTHQKIGFGNHRGNRFTIVVRGCSHADGRPMTEEEALSEAESIKEKLSQSLGAGVFPNWIGPQRFGSGRPVTAEVGRHVLNGDYQQAVLTYLSMEGFEENVDVATFRKYVRENGPVVDALELAPKWLGFETRMIEHLVNNPEDYLGAFKKLPNNLQLMTIHAAQSIIFNKSLNRRITSGFPISTPIEGDLVGRIDEKGQLNVNSCVIVDSRTLPRLTRNCQLGRLVTTGPLPGSETYVAGGESEKIELSAISDCGLDEVDWLVEEIPRLSTKGTRRALVSNFQDMFIDTVPVAAPETLGEKWNLGPNDNSRWHPDGACLRFRFSLSSGSYATTLLREFMKCPLNQL
ncbi:MAG: tRNA pseudouridine(13) synthase TruD [Candidatus Thermoplasmatota archaeon]|nr:tRNA pseudouridine(13) synthase TruD [Candidatus Thermoplasmatota archaeon]